jgi:hypothetical protein
LLVAFKQDAASQFTKRAGTRAARNAALLGASHARRSPCPDAPSQAPVFFRAKKYRCFAVRRAVFGAGDLWGGEEASAACKASVLVGARSALRPHYCRILFERSEQGERSELCGTTKTRAPQRSRSEAETAPP